MGAPTQSKVTKDQELCDQQATSPTKLQKNNLWKQQDQLYKIEWNSSH